LTEASPVTHVNPPDKIRANSIGVPLPSTLAGIVNPATLEFLPIGSTGELVVSGPQVMRGYLEGDEVLFEAYGRKWLRTGDICFMDGEGYFYFVERAKDIIKHKGFTVYPAEIENLLLESGFVKEAAVVGAPDMDVGERIVAFVVPNPGLGGEDVVGRLRKLCEERLAEYKRPHQITTVSELPKSPVGKILRRAVRERLKT
jgi:long-chain acyl-CoA synthetase